MPHLRPAVLAAAAVVVATTTACDPIAVPDSTSRVERTGAFQCEEGWVCGTCPDGLSWGYLDDPKYTNDPVLSTLFFDTKRPCG